MVIKDQVSNETAARAYSQQGHGNQQADPKAGYISATSRRRAIELLRTAAGTYIGLVFLFRCIMHERLVSLMYGPAAFRSRPHRAIC